MDDDEVVAQSLERRVKWSMDASADDCSRVFQKVVKLEKCMKDALKRKEDADKIQQLYQMLRTVRMYMPAETSNEEEEKTAEQVDEDLTPLEIVVETRPQLDGDFESHRKAAAQLLQIEQVEIDGVKFARIKNSIAVCKNQDCFVQEAHLSVYALVILNELSKSNRSFINFEWGIDEKAHTLMQCLESFGKEQVAKTPSMQWNEDRIIFTGIKLGGNNREYHSEFEKFMHADLVLRNNSEQDATEQIRQEYVNIWNTVCSPEFIYAITKPEDRIGREFPQNGNTAAWKKSLEGVNENYNQVCNEVVGYADEWCVNILITPRKIFFPRLAPDLALQNYQRYVALCRYDDAAQGFGLLVFDNGPRQLTFVRNIESTITGKHLSALQDWFARGFAKYAGEDRRELPQIKVIDFSAKTDSWQKLCEKLGGSSQSVSWCVLNSLSEDDKCTGGFTGEARTVQITGGGWSGFYGGLAAGALAVGALTVLPGVLGFQGAMAMGSAAAGWLPNVSGYFGGSKLATAIVGGAFLSNLNSAYSAYNKPTGKTKIKKR